MLHSHKRAARSAVAICVVSLSISALSSATPMNNIRVSHGFVYQWSPPKVAGPVAPKLVISASAPTPSPVLPVTPPDLCPVSEEFYVVVSGDTLSGIAAKCRTAWKTLATANGLVAPYRIFPGDRLAKTGVRAPVLPPVKASAPPSQAPPPSQATGVIETAIGFAMAQLGDPYVWAGNGPNGWDCSGLIHAAFRAAGVVITRSTKTLINEGHPVSQSAMQRGDLVFPSSGHVGIYLGGGQMIHAPQPGDVVKIGSVYSFYAARRVA